MFFSVYAIMVTFSVEKILLKVEIFYLSLVLQKVYRTEGAWGRSESPHIIPLFFLLQSLGVMPWRSF